MIDPAGRTVDYLRISVTDRCNERCLYCMPEHYSAWLPRADMLTYEEILAIARTGVRLGFKRFRVTGKGRVRRSKAGGNHGMQEKSRKRLRRNRNNDMVHKTMEKHVKKLIPYG